MPVLSRRFVLVVLLVVLAVLVVGVLVCWCCANRATELFATSKPTPPPPPPYYDVGTPVFIRFDSKICFYAGVITRIPKSTDKTKTYTVRYGKDYENPRNSETEYSETVTATECYGAAGNTRTPAEQCRVFRLGDTFKMLPNDATATQRKYYQMDETAYDYINSLMFQWGDTEGDNDEMMQSYLHRQLQCNPSIFTFYMNIMYPLSFENLLGGITDGVHARIKQARQKAEQEKAAAKRKAEAAKAQAAKQAAAKQKEAQEKSAAALQKAETKMTQTSDVTTSTTTLGKSSNTNAIADAIVYQKALQLGYDRGDRMNQHQELVNEQIANRLREYDKMVKERQSKTSTTTSTVGGNPESALSAKQRKEINARSHEVVTKWKQTQAKSKQAYSERKQQLTALAKHLNPGNLTQPQASYLALVDSIMKLLWANTYVDVRVDAVNTAPSPTSDTYHTCTTSTPSGRTGTVSAPPSPNYATTSGCTPSKTTLTNTALHTHPKGCTCTTYQFTYGQNLNVHMVGSDVDGSRVCVYLQHLVHLGNTFQTTVGAKSDVLDSFVGTILELMRYSYFPMRKYLSVQNVEKLVHALMQEPLPASKTSSALLQTVNSAGFAEYAVLVNAQGVTLNSPAPNDPPAYKTPYNRMLPFVGAAAYSSTSVNTSATRESILASSPDHFCCEHDALVSVGSGNSDLTAEVSIAAYANATCARFDVNPHASLLSEQAMLNHTRKGAAVPTRRNDTVMLTGLLRVYLAKTCGEVVEEIHLPPLQDKGMTKSQFKRAQTNEKAAFYASVKQMLLLTAAQLLSIVSGVTPSFVMRSKPFTTWFNTLAIKPTKAQLATRAAAVTDILATFIGTPQGEAASTSYLYPSPQNVPNAVTHVRVKVPSHSMNRHTISVTVPWNTTVFGVQAFVDEFYQNTIEVVAVPPDTCSGSSCNCAVRIRRVVVAGSTSAGWNAPFYIYVTKRVFVERLHLNSYLSRFLSGYHHTTDPLANHITSLPVYKLSTTALDSATSERYYNGKVYRSWHTEKCYRVSCESTVDGAASSNTQQCCTGKDVTDCPTTVLQEAPCPPKASSTHAKHAPCHQPNPSALSCQAAFQQMLNNARNACLVLDADAVPDFFAFLTDETDCGTNLRLLCKTVKTLTFTTTAFRKLSVNVTQQAEMAAAGKHHGGGKHAPTKPVAENVPSETRDHALLLQRVLVTLFTCYGVVGLVAPPVLSDRTATMSDPSLFQQTVNMQIDEPCKKDCLPFTNKACARSSQNTVQSVYTMYDELTLTLQRRYENSEPVFAQSMTLSQLQFFEIFVEAIETMMANNAREHHQALQFFPSVSLIETVLSTSCNPYMLSTIRGISWYGKDPLPKDIPDSQNELLPRCQTTT